jgi:hypothetical protein
MPIAGKDAMSFVNQHFTSKQIRNYAVSDFLNYRDWAAAWAPWAEFQKTWALYLKWKALAAANHDYASANGTAFRIPVKFFYTEAAETDTVTDAAAPTLEGTQVTGSKPAELKGVGQCEYFADLAYGNMKMRSPVGRTGPLVQKIATPGHNWVRANGDAPEADIVYVDYWLFAMGVPAAKSVCLSGKSVFSTTGMTVKVLKTYNPNSGLETFR